MDAVSSRPPAAWRRLLPVGAPIVVGVVFQLLGHPLRAGILWALAALTLVLVLAGVPVERYLMRAGVWVAEALGWVASMLVGVLLVVAGWLLRVFGQDPLTPRSRRGNGWQPAPSRRDSDHLATATFGLERLGTIEPAQRGVAAPLRWAVTALGALALLVLADVALGTAWHQLAGAEPEAAQIADGINMTGNTETVDDPRTDHPAMEGSPWAEEYFREVQLTPSSYWPFTESRPREFDGEFVNIEGWERLSYVSPDAGEDAPVVWMFGGSTTWGEGQRDEYTIASYLARLAEAEGEPIVVRNFGQRGWTHFQEMILFEQLLAAGPAPDVAVFYDGANEINAQSLSVKGVPTHTLVDQYAELISGGVAEEFTAPPPEPPSTWSVLWDTYVEQSAIQQTVRALRGVVDPAAGASPSSLRGPSSPAQAGDDAERNADGGQVYVKTVEDGKAALDVYERGRDLSMSLAAAHDVEPVFYWQPVLALSEAEVWARENMSAPTVDVSDTLDADPGVYIDGGHTNEEGARLVAERLWADLRERLSS